jgi:hypothetical protein
MSLFTFFIYKEDQERQDQKEYIGGSFAASDDDSFLECIRLLITVKQLDAIL